MNQPASISENGSLFRWLLLTLLISLFSVAGSAAFTSPSTGIRTELPGPSPAFRKRGAWHRGWFRVPHRYSVLLKSVLRQLRSAYQTLDKTWFARITKRRAGRSSSALFLPRRITQSGDRNQDDLPKG